MPDTYFIVLELTLFFVSIPLIFNALNALELSQIFRKGHSKHIQVLYIAMTIIISYLLSSALANVLHLSFNLLN